VAIDWGKTYEAPISLDAARMICTRARRPTLWTLAAFAGALPALVVCVWQEMPLLAPVATFWVLVCYVFGTTWGLRPAEYWFGVWARHNRIPRHMQTPEAVQTHHAAYALREHAVVDLATQQPRGVVVLEQTANLRLADDDTLASTIKRLGLFLNGLRFPIQIVVRATLRGDGLIERRWYVATLADDEALLRENLAAIESGLARAGLRGRALNGDLFDELQHCWSAKDAKQLGPIALHRTRRHVQAGDEFVRGFLLAKMPRAVEPNWLAPILDGDLPIDFSMWLDPTENADEVQYLADRVNEWETAQQLNVLHSGFRDPDIDESINDAKRTRLFLRRRELRVFRASIGFAVRSKTEAGLRDLERQLAINIREQVGDEALLPLDWEHDRAVKMVVPLGEPPATEWPLRTVTPAIARGYPFSNSSLSHARGVDVGTSVGSRRQNKLDLFGLANPHAVVLGTSGAGKGYWIKVFLWRMLHAYPWDERVRVFVIQSEKDEYSALVDAMEQDDLGARGDVVRIHNQTDLDRLLFGIGMLRAFRDITVFDLTPMSSAARGAAVARVLEAIESEMGRVRRRRHAICVVDELGIVLESAEAAQAIETAYRRFRSIPWQDQPREVNRVAMIGASQRPSDLLRHPRGKVLADLAMTHLYLRQKPTELKTVAGQLGLSVDEQNFLDCAEQGTGLMVADLARVGLHLYASDEERRFAET
jgi:hypothetical protein